VFKIILFQLLIKPSNIDIAEDRILTEFINAFEDKATSQNWLDSRGIKDLCALELHNEIISKVRDILLSAINNNRHKDLKFLIMETNMDLYEIGNTYYETFNVISSVKRILKMNEDDHVNMLNFSEEIIYEEYDEIYTKLQLTIVEIGRQFNFLETLLSYITKKLDINKEPLAVTKNYTETVNLLNSINNLIDSFLPMDVETPVNVKASLRDFRSSKKCFGDEINFSLKGMYTYVCTNEILFQKLTRCNWFNKNLNDVDINKFMSKRFLCNQTTVKLLILLFHYYSEIQEKDTKYKIKLKENNEYKITWSYALNRKLESIKKYWLAKEITNFKQRKIIHKFGFIVDFTKEYSTKM
jgi:hypothetical protein